MRIYKTQKLLKGILGIVMILSMVKIAYAQKINVATYNIRYSIAKNHKFDSVRGEDWTRRGPAIAALIRFHDFDIFGTQEGMPHQLDDLLSWLPEYRYTGVGRDDGKNAGEHAAIFYKSTTFTLLNHGDFWLSETPDKPSLGWDATCCNRICSWALFEHKPSGEQFYFFNTHFDHQGVVARKESSKLILQKIRTIAGKKPIILTGDLNGGQQSEWYYTLANSGLLRDTYHIVQHPYAPNGSFNGFGRSTKGNSIIDHIFISNHFGAFQWGMLTDTYHGKFPSDHFPVTTTIFFDPKP